jgi:dTDP-4-dehydrorhamnose reductase
MSKVLILGASGMLGSMVCDYFTKNSDFEITASLRDLSLSKKIKSLSKIECICLDADDLRSVKKSNLTRFDWIINAIGIIKPYIKEGDCQSIETAIKINALFPHCLADELKDTNTRIIQIATDCVFSGRRGSYSENSPHDPPDVYGKTKSLGEAETRNFHNLRCSIIGPEIRSKLSLLEWFLGQKRNGKVTGFKNHLWNGITTLHFAKICKGIIENGLCLPSKQNIIPSGILSKAEILKIFALIYKRGDIKINERQVLPAQDRTLVTENPQINTRLWVASGYKTPPSIEVMISELASYNYDK